MKYKNEVAELPVNVMPISKNGVKKTTQVLNLITPNLTIHSAIKISPAMAEELLSLNVGNRPLTKAIVDRYTDYMKKGKWVFSGNTIKFSTKKVLQDGQHSLNAVVNSNTTQVFNIQTGLDPQSFTVMDTGRLRSAGDVLAMKGFHEYYALGSAIKSTIYFETTGRLRSNLPYITVTNAQVEEFTERPDMDLMRHCLDFGLLTRAEKRTLFISCSIWAFIYFALSKIHTELATEFCTLLSKGENISMSRNPAIYLLREKLIAFGDQHSKEFRKGGTAVIELKLRYIFKAWNIWRKKESITKLQVNVKEPIEKPI